MKITVDIDCTPEEARRLMGLPDVSQVHEEIAKELQKRIRAGLDTMDPQTLLRSWLPAGAEGWEQFQKMFWSNLAGAAGKPTDE